MLNRFCPLFTGKGQWLSLAYCVLSLFTPAVNAKQFPQQKLLAQDGAAEDFFGFSVAVFNDTALIGAYRSDDKTIGADVGSAYVFARKVGRWQQQAKLVPSDANAQDTFGGNLALFEDTAVVGSIGHDQNGENSGAVYVFSRSSEGWRQQAKLLAADGAEGDAFGQSLAVSDDTIIVGAPHDNDKGKSSGSVYIFSRLNDAWVQQAKLVAPDGAEGDVFGISVAFSEDTVLIGADLNDERANNAGAAYVFTRQEGNWTFQAKLMADDGGDTDIFGVRVALSGDTALISARRDDDEQMGVDSGSAYVFVRNGDTWQQQTKLTAPDGAADDRFGRGVALAGETALISAMHQDDKGDNSGAVYVFQREGNNWQYQSKSTANDGAAGDLFGWNLALSHGLAIVSAPRNDDQGNESGAAYIFEVNVNANNKGY